MYDNPHMDSYMSDEQDGSLGAGLGSIHPFGGIGLADDLDADDKALLGTKRKVWSNRPSVWCSMCTVSCMTRDSGSHGVALLHKGGMACRTAL